MTKKRRSPRSPPELEAAKVTLPEQAGEGMKLAQALLHIFYYCRFSGDDCEPCKVLKPFIDEYFNQLYRRMGESGESD